MLINYHDIHYTFNFEFMMDTRHRMNKSLTSSAETLQSVLSDGRLRQAQLKMFKMLQVIDDICMKHDIDYWLDAGTLLGAVRHQGFIPWDDDMDIAMPRESYEKFLRVAAAEMPEHMCIQEAGVVKGYFNMGAPVKIRDKTSYYLEKYERGDETYVQGIFIDIFVYDKMPVNEIKRNLYKRLSKKILRITGTKFSPIPMGHYHKFYRLIGSFLSKAFLDKAMYKIINRANQSSSPYLGRGYHCKKTTLVAIKDIYPLKRAQFESGYFNIPNHAETILSTEYGDYLSLPPEEERILRHCVALVPELDMS